LEQKAKDDAISSFERQLSELTQKIAELERRLSVLERSSGPRQVNPQPKLTGQLPQPAKSLARKSYLERMVDAARREHEREGT